ncbi:hypothetical protein A2801_02180 [Candidatus Woesebacteria bacterium RIFCSPHIGHO2_01_FULL_41_10]|uniref:TrpR like protein, YerC/YecD n=1 Tax=Candidatus Woesebacteria bacterium RIFCSPHIGHO2_01_FULL_41_10 TaxID=1802500 RepID=A0A1F7YQZ7_9BACT|nr:MAG: hypothetical protein A2801_02180 [Candidatus Woesebacteria bacterium RIFCSPHIGHO2_01_FULL_41_10]
MRTSRKQINKILQKQIRHTLVQALADMKSPEEIETFVNGFFTEAEIETFSKRLAIAYWLKKGRSYTNIKENLKVSSATIASVQEQIEKEGLQLAIKKMEADEWANVWTERIKGFIGK